MFKFDIIVAMNKNSLIGLVEYGVHTLPWPFLKQDMKYFKSKITSIDNDGKKNAIIVGYNTWITLSQNCKKSQYCDYIVVSKIDLPNHTLCAKTFIECLNIAKSLENICQIYVIGGSSTYYQALKHPDLDKIYITHINQTYPSENIVEQYIYFPLNISMIKQFVSDNFLEILYQSDEIIDKQPNIGYHFFVYKTSNNFCQYYNQISENIKYKISVSNVPSVNNEEYQYLDLIQKILSEGVVKKTRNAITKSIFGFQLRYNLSNGYPIPTVKKCYPKAIFEELMWMIRGQTNVKILQEKGVHIWDKNSTSDFLRNANLSYNEGDIGPGYGFQMRYFGAKYNDCQTDYTGKGFDQLNDCIRLINDDPHSRRIIICLWNASDISKMALPPCPLIYHFSVDLYPEQTNGKKGKLNCHLFQRSWDVLLGWNTTTAALLTYLLAHHCYLDPGILVHSISDAHIYQNHIESGAINCLMSRSPRKPPQLFITSRHENITDYKYDDLILYDYYPCPPICAEMIA